MISIIIDHLQISKMNLIYSISSLPHKKQLPNHSTSPNIRIGRVHPLLQSCSLFSVVDSDVPVAQPHTDETFASQKTDNVTYICEPGKLFADGSRQKDFMCKDIDDWDEIADLQCVGK